MIKQQLDLKAFKEGCWETHALRSGCGVGAALARQSAYGCRISSPTAAPRRELSFWEPSRGTIGH